MTALELFTDETRVKTPTNLVVKNYVPHTPVPPEPYILFSRNQVPQTLETKYPLLSKPVTPYTRNHVPSTLDNMYFHERFDEKKVEKPQQSLKSKVKALSFQ